MIEVVINGLVMGSVYSLTAVGLTLIFGTMKVINFAHGSFIMMGAYAGYWLFVLTGIDPYISLVVIAPLFFLLGYFVNSILINPIFKRETGVREPIEVLVLTGGLWIFLDNSALMWFGPNFRTAQTFYTGKMFNIGNVLISMPKLYAFVIAMITSLSLYLFLKKTRMGRAIRATGQDRDMASLMSINVYQIYNITFGVGIAMTAIAGACLVPFYPIYPNVGFVFDIRAFVIVVLGGLGSVPGALLGGLIVGLIDSIGAQFITSTWTSDLVFIMFLVVLYIRPQGMFGFEKEW